MSGEIVARKRQAISRLRLTEPHHRSKILQHHFQRLERVHCDAVEIRGSESVLAYSFACLIQVQVSYPAMRTWISQGSARKLANRDASFGPHKCQACVRGKLLRNAALNKRTVPESESSKNVAVHSCGRRETVQTLPAETVGHCRKLSRLTLQHGQTATGSSRTQCPRVVLKKLVRIAEKGWPAGSALGSSRRIWHSAWRASSMRAFLPAQPRPFAVAHSPPGHSPVPARVRTSVSLERRFASMQSPSFSASYLFWVSTTGSEADHAGRPNRLDLPETPRRMRPSGEQPHSSLYA